MLKCNNIVSEVFDKIVKIDQQFLNLTVIIKFLCYYTVHKEIILKIRIKIFNQFCY